MEYLRHPFHKVTPYRPSEETRDRRHESTVYPIRLLTLWQSNCTNHGITPTDLLICVDTNSRLHRCTPERSCLQSSENNSEWVPLRILSVPLLCPTQNWIGTFNVSWWRRRKMINDHWLSIWSSLRFTLRDGELPPVSFQYSISSYTLPSVTRLADTFCVGWWR